MAAASSFVPCDSLKRRTMLLWRSSCAEEFCANARRGPPSANAVALATVPFTHSRRVSMARLLQRLSVGRKNARQECAFRNFSARQDKTGYASGVPEANERAILAADGIAGRPWHPGNGLERLGVLGLAAAAQIVHSALGISADHAKLGRRPQALMAGAGRQHDDVAGGDVEHLARCAAEAHLGAAAR